MIPEPMVRVTRTWRLTYQRPRIDGWPLVLIKTSLNLTGYSMEPQRIVITVIGGSISRRIIEITVHGSWVDGGHSTVQQLDLPGARHGHTPAPDWIVEITGDALRRAV